MYALNSNIHVFLSKDTVVNTQDSLLNYSTGGALSANGSELRKMKVNIPVQADTGNYFILFYTDFANAVSESIENNNLSYIKLNVSLVGIKENNKQERILISPNM